MKYILFALIIAPIFACTGISIQTQDGKHIQARTIEWGEFPLQSQLIISPKNKEFQSLTPEGRNGIKWKAKYGFVGISVISNDFIGEGLNEAGLNAGLFYFAHFGSLAPYNSKDSGRSISDMELTKYILSNFRTTQEVKKAFETLKVVPFMLENGKAPPTAHWRVTDANGGNIVIEIIEGEVKIYDNPIGVLTNSPSFPWHLTNLNNYLNLHAGSAQPFELKKLKLFAMGAGTGLFGLPGDFTPPSRFVRASFFLHTAPTPANAYQGVMQAFHILNLFDLPIGTEFQDKSKIPSSLPSATQWTATSNLNDLEFLYKTMHNGRIRKINLKQIDFSNVKFQSLKLDQSDKEDIEELQIK